MKVLETRAHQLLKLDLVAVGATQWAISDATARKLTGVVGSSFALADCIDSGDLTGWDYYGVNITTKLAAGSLNNAWTALDIQAWMAMGPYDPSADRQAITIAGLNRGSGSPGPWIDGSHSSQKTIGSPNHFLYPSSSPRYGHAGFSFSASQYSDRLGPIGRILWTITGTPNNNGATTATWEFYIQHVYGRA